MIAERGPPKKKKGTTKVSTKTSIDPSEFESTPPCMSFSPRSKSHSGSNQPEALSIEYPGASCHSGEQVEKAPTKTKGKKRAAPKEKIEKSKKLKQDIPAMGTRSKVIEPSSSAMSTRSKRRLRI
ncbi:unnamed protein product [Urochloa humidicola]